MRGALHGRCPEYPCKLNSKYIPLPVVYQKNQNNILETCISFNKINRRKDELGLAWWKKSQFFQTALKIARTEK